MVFNVTGYHTCKAKGGIQHIRKSVPFLSLPDNQWLGQGYYFWTDDAYWARDWLNQPKVISEFTIELDKIKVLDLVGDVKHQILFNDICSLFKDGGIYQEAYSEKYGGDIFITHIFSWLREECKIPGEEDLFPYWAVRAKDKRFVSKFPFHEKGREELLLVERHQMCVYSEYKDQIVKFEKFVHPSHFAEHA